jgi:hypothetical protein
VGQSAANTIQAGADGKGYVNYAFDPAKLTVPVNTPDADRQQQRVPAERCRAAAL